MVESLSDWKIFFEDDESDFNTVKRTYFAVHKDSGIRKDFDVSPYGFTSLGHLRKLIEMGFPTRKEANTIGCLTIEMIDSLYENFKSKNEWLQV